MSRAIGLVLGVSLGVPAVNAFAQVGPGTRVRVTESGGKRVVGSLVSIDDSTLAVKTGGSAEAVVVSRSTLTQIDVSERPSRKGRGALIGFVVGALAGAIAGASSASDCSRDEFLCIFPREDKTKLALGGAAVFGALGAGVGAVVAPGEKWRSVPAARPPLVVGAVHGGGVRLAVSFAF